MAILKEQSKRRSGVQTAVQKKRKEAVQPNSGEEQKIGQEKWDALLAMPESDALLMLLVAEAKRNVAEGNFDGEDW